MTKLLLVFLLFTYTWKPQDTTVVYIATTYGAEVYHKNLKCGALKGPIKHRTVRCVSLEEAQKMYRRPCLKCYRNKSNR